MTEFKSSDYLIPKVMKSPSEMPEPEQSKRMTLIEFCNNAFK